MVVFHWSYSYTLQEKKISLRNRNKSKPEDEARNWAYKTEETPPGFQLVHIDETIGQTVNFS